MSNEKKKSRYDEAVSKARGETHAGEVHEDLIGPGDVATIESLSTITREQGGAAITTFDPAALSQMMAAGDLEAAPQLFTLETGMMITGRLDSAGETELLDVATKLPKKVRTWQLTLGRPDALGRPISILGAAQLDRMLGHFPIGSYVVIARGETKQVAGKKGTQMTDYFVGKLKVGG